MPPKKNSSLKRPTSSSSSNPPKPQKSPTRPPRSVKFDIAVCTTSHHAGCKGTHHQHENSKPASRRNKSNSHIVVANSSSKHISNGKGEPFIPIPQVPIPSPRVSIPRPQVPTPSPRVSIPSPQMSIPRSAVSLTMPPGIITPSKSSLKTSTIPPSKSRKHVALAIPVPSPVQEKVINNNSPVLSSIQQQCSSSVIVCSGTSAMRLMGSMSAPINFLKGCNVLFQEKILKKIFSYLNHSDLVQCRLVHKHWKNLISKDEHFLRTTEFVVNIQKSYDVETDRVVYNDFLQSLTVPYRHARFQYIDHRFYKEPEFFVFRNSDNEKYFPSPNFLKNLFTLEITNSYLLWSTLRRILAKAKLLDKMVISNCHVSDTAVPSKTQEFDDFSAGNTIFGMKSLELYENHCLDNITRVLKKFTGYNNQNLATLKITYDPPANPSKILRNTKSSGFDFCRELKALISLCSNSLKVLVLDIHQEQTLDLLAYHLSKELQALGSILDLKEFQLSPSIGVWLHKPEEMPHLNVSMTMNSDDNDAEKSMKDVASSLGDFLGSQKNLKKLGLPCMEFADSKYSQCFKSLFKGIPCAPHLQYLAVPCAGFLPEDFLTRFPKLKQLKVGTPFCGELTSAWDIFRCYNGQFISSPQESEFALQPINTERRIVRRSQPQISLLTTVATTDSLDMMKHIEQLCISTLECPAKFSILVKSLCNLTSLEVGSGLATPILCDADLQACVKYLTRLKSLVISCSDNLTDFGITGIPGKICQLMFKHQRYHLEGVNPYVWNSQNVRGRPLSDLKGLRTLVLMGNSAFTDIGIAYGLTFNELKYCHLPYSDNITSWGIERFGLMNPSIESFMLSGVSQLTKRAFQQLRKKHDRLKKGDAGSRSGYFMEFESQLVDNISLILPSPPEVLTDMLKWVSGKFSSMFKVSRDARNLEMDIITD